MQKHIRLVVGALQIIVTLLPFIYWLDKIDYKIGKITALQLFPLLGLLAFSTMWLHFVVGTMRRIWPDAMDYKRYFRITGNFVLALILLHPGLLFYKTLETGGKITAISYVGQSHAVFVLFAFVALGIFLLYEVADRMRERAWIKDRWPYIKALNVSAFVLIFWHGFIVGQHLQSGWLRWLWIFYGTSTLLFIAHGYWYDLTRAAKKSA